MTRIIGIDISKWNMSYVPDMAPKKADFVIQRASYVGSLSRSFVVDEKFHAFLPEVRKCEIRGAYHYMLNGDKLHWSIQADRFIDLVGDKGFHFYVCDWESAYNTLNCTFAAEAFEWMNKVQGALGKPVLLYTNRNGMDNYLMPCDGARISRFPFWYAAPVYNADTTNPQTYTPTPCKTRPNYSICQFAFADYGVNNQGANYGVGSRGVDLNFYNGTVDEMKAWLGINSSTTNPPPPPPNNTALDVSITINIKGYKSKTIETQLNPE